MSVPQKRLLFLVINFSNSHSFLFSCEFSLIAFIISTHNLSIFLALAEQATDYKSAAAGVNSLSSWSCLKFKLPSSECTPDISALIVDQPAGNFGDFILLSHGLSKALSIPVGIMADCQNDNDMETFINATFPIKILSGENILELE